MYKSVKPGHEKYFSIALLAYVTGFAKRDLFDRLFKIKFSSHSSAIRIALNSGLIKAYHTVQLSS